MSTHHKLGRGIDALLETQQEQTSTDITEVSLDLLRPNPWQPRIDFAQDRLEELAQSIKNQGIVQPLLVRQMPDGTYQIVAGERRFRAAKLANLRSAPVFVRKMTDDEVMTAALIENLQREDLNPLEEAQALKSLRDSLNITQDALATKLGRSRSSVANSLRLLQLSTEAQEDLRRGALTAGHARSLLALSDGELAEGLRKYIITQNLSVRETEQIITNWKATGEVPWANDSSDEPIAAEKSVRKKNPKQPKSEIAQKMQEIISQVMTCQTKVQGNEEKGRIILKYSTSLELQQILEKIGAATLSEFQQEGENQTNSPLENQPFDASESCNETALMQIDQDISDTELDTLDDTTNVFEENSHDAETKKAETE